MRTLIVLLLFAAVVLLQIFLSKRENKWSGLVLPAIAFCFALLYPLNMTVFCEVTAAFILQMLIVWIMGNIPTFILLAIYFACRGKNKKNKQLNKMNIQDLN